MSGGILVKYGTLAFGFLMKHLRMFCILNLLLFVILFAYAISWYIDFGHAPVERSIALQGKTEREIDAVLGKCDYSNSFMLNDGLDQLRIELLNHYSNEQISYVKIYEKRWRFRRYTIVVWFHYVNGEWVVIDNCRFQAGVKF
jgi:hypothetical protein